MEDMPNTENNVPREYKNITPQQAHEITVQHIDWKPILQDALDVAVPVAARNGKNNVMIDITHPYPEGRFDSETIDQIVRLLDTMGWNCSSNRENGTHGFFCSHLFKVNW